MGYTDPNIAAASRPSARQRSWKHKAGAVQVWLDTLHSHQLDAFSKYPVQLRPGHSQPIEVGDGDRRQVVFADDNDSFVGRNRDSIHAVCIVTERLLSIAPNKMPYRDP
jgi:hypothetical protein